MTIRRRLNVPLLLGFLIVLGSVAFRLSRTLREVAHEEAAPGLAVGTPAPEFTLQRFDDGAPVTSSELLDRPLVVNFWGTWWDPRVPDTKVLIDGARRFGDKVRFIGVLYDDTKDKGAQFLAELPTPYAQFLDDGGAAARAFGLNRTPATIFISTDRMIRMMHEGSMRTERLDVQVDNLLSIEAALREQNVPPAPVTTPQTGGPDVRTDAAHAR